MEDQKTIDIKELKDGTTYVITFPEYYDLDYALQVVKNTNKYLRENNRNIVFVYMPASIKITEKTDEK